MPVQKHIQLKELIRRPPHWAIRFGTVFMTFLIAGFLIISTQLSLPDRLDIPVELDVLATTPVLPSETAMDSIAGYFVIPPRSEEVGIGESGTIRLYGNFGSYSYPTSIHYAADGQAFVRIPRMFSPDGQQMIRTDCNVAITLEVPAEDITLYQKLVESLFSSFNF